MSDAPNGAVTPEQPLSVTLSIAQWRAVLETLARPLVPIQQLIGDIERQCQTQIQRLQDVAAGHEHADASRQWRGRRGTRP